MEPVPQGAEDRAALLARAMLRVAMRIRSMQVLVMMVGFASCATVERRSVPQGNPEIAAEMFAALADLAGDWKTGDAEHSNPAQFEIVSRGKAVTQNSGFFAVFALEGGNITLSVFPDDGAQARLIATVTEAGGLEFMTDGPPSCATCSRPTSMMMRLRARDEVVQTWNWSGGKEGPFDLVFHRVIDRR